MQTHSMCSLLCSTANCLYTLSCNIEHHTSQENHASKVALTQMLHAPYFLVDSFDYLTDIRRSYKSRRPNMIAGVCNKITIPDYVSKVLCV